MDSTTDKQSSTTITTRRESFKQSSRIVHISDLHFNRIDTEVVEATLRLIETLSPELVICSGDVTMRARIREFIAARAFLDKLPVPWLCTPGNHDIPAVNLLRRSLRPFSRYKKFISADLAPVYEGSNYVAAGLNTARRGHLRTFDWSRGRVSKSHLAKMEAELSKIDASKHRIVFAHHPFALPPGTEHRGIVTRFSKALRSFERASVDLVLAGHLHLPHIETLKASKLFQSNDARKPVISVQAATTTSLRLKGRPNSLNVIHLSGQEIQIDRHEWDGATFSTSHQQTFKR